MSDFSNAVEGGGVVFAAIAAGASWLSVINGQRAAREARRPNLQASAITVPGKRPNDDPMVVVSILNAGLGVAKGVAFVVVGGDEYCSNALGPGFLRYQETARVELTMQAHEDTRVLVVCRDLGKRIWAWEGLGNHKTYDGNKLDPVRDFQSLWSEFYGEDLSKLQRIGSKVTIGV